MILQDDSYKPIKFHYIFKFADGNTASFEILLDSKTLNCITSNTDPPEWAKLTYCQCKNCPLDESRHTFCPIASNIAGLVDTFKDFSAYETAFVLVMTKQREISKSTTVQEGLSSLLGVYMVTSGCPIMEKLKPIVRYHLPFATLQEQVFRVVSMYLLVQYFLMRKGKKPDWELKNLEGIYEDISLVNAGFSMRLKNAAQKDASLTALASLDYTASLLPLVINDTLDAIENSLSSYMKD
jgi:hypothetical protein